MPCYRCGVRQTDPVRGPSPWKRGVRMGTQVLVCPGCQRGRDWAADMDRCAACGSTMLVRLLGETQCRSCGARVESPAAGTRAEAAEASVPGLAGDVQAALDRLFGRARS
jgi:predicted amidophosphoribosyltransferase